MYSYNLSTSVYGLDNTHKGFISFSTENFINYEGELYYTGNNTLPVTSANNTHYEIYKYNFSNKIPSVVVDLDNPTFTPDGVNFLEVNQAPIYLELQ